MQPGRRLSFLGIPPSRALASDWKVGNSSFCHLLGSLITRILLHWNINNLACPRKRDVSSETGGIPNTAGLVRLQSLRFSEGGAAVLPVPGRTARPNLTRLSGPHNTSARESDVELVSTMFLARRILSRPHYNRIKYIRANVCVGMFSLGHWLPCEDEPHV